MRLLVLYQAATHPRGAHPGFFDGFERLVSDGVLDSHISIPYFSVAQQVGWDGMWDVAFQAAATHRADAVFLQFFHSDRIPNPTKGIERLRTLPSRPTLFTSLGDPFGRWTARMPSSFRQASALCDITFSTSTGYIATQLVRSGTSNIVLMPHGWNQLLWNEADNSPNSDEFDVVFVGNRMRTKNLASHFWPVAKRRHEFVRAYSMRYGSRFGLFGKGWEGIQGWQGPVPFLDQIKTYRRGAVVAGGTPNADNDFYTSDRPFIAAASRIPLVDFYVPGVDQILRDRQDWWLGDSIGSMLKRTDTLLEMSESDRIRLGETAYERAFAVHQQYHRCRSMVEIVAQLRSARMSGGRAALPGLPFLLPPKPGAPELPAIVNWRG